MLPFKKKVINLLASQLQECRAPSLMDVSGSDPKMQQLIKVCSGMTSALLIVEARSQGAEHLLGCCLFIINFAAMT